MGDKPSESFDLRKRCEAVAPARDKQACTKRAREAMRQFCDVMPFADDLRDDVWGNGDFSVERKGGDYTRAEELARTEKLPNGEVVLRDVGVVFYKVRPGDSIWKIRQRLSKYKEFAYLQDLPEDRLSSFNINPRDLQAHMWLPIPRKPEDRHLEEPVFANYCSQAIDELGSHRVYGPKLKKLLEKVSKRDLIALMMAVAKSECGKSPLGQFTFFRYEKRHKAFSYSIFHVLMVGPGLKARSTLNMTEGQTYHPKNAAKLFLGFLFEKSGDPSKFFPVLDKLEDFATFYNGSGWRINNKAYPGRIKGHYKDAQDILKGADFPVARCVKRAKPVVVVADGSGVVKGPVVKPVAKPIVKPKVAPAEKTTEITKMWESARVQLFTVGKGTNLVEAILNSNWANSQRAGIPSILETNANARKCAERILQYLEDMYGDYTYFADDKIGVGVDKHGPFILFKRRGQDRAFLRFQE